MAPFIDEKGLSIKRQNEILIEMLCDAQVLFLETDEKIDASPNSLLGNFLHVFSSQIADIWEAIQEVYDAFNPCLNEGKNLDDSCALSGIARLEPSYTKVFVTLIGKKGTKVASGFMLGCTINNELFVNQNECVLEEQINNSDLYRAVGLFVAQNCGPLICPPKTLTHTITALHGLSNASNENAPISMGRLLESDTELRIRRTKSGSIFGQNVAQALQSKLLNINGVSTALVIENASMETINHIPPKSFHVIVEGGDADEIAQIIWQNKPAGIATYGELSIKIPLITGQFQELFFTRPRDIPIYIKVFYNKNPDELFPENGEQLIKEATKEYGNKLGINKDVIDQRFFGAIFNHCPGILKLDLQVSKDNLNFSNEVIIGKTEYPTFKFMDIMVSEYV